MSDNRSEVSERYRRIADGFTARVEGVPSEHWSARTPCSEWNVRDLVAHVVGTHWRVGAALDQRDPVEVDPNGDLLRQWRDARAAIVAALDDEGRASTVVSGMFGDQPFVSLVGRLLCADTLVHTWDLAGATGQDERLDPDGVARAIEFLTPIDEPMRGPRGFAPKITPPAGADEQTKLLNFCGRAP